MFDYHSHGPVLSGNQWDIIYLMVYNFGMLFAMRYIVIVKWFGCEGHWIGHWNGDSIV